MLKFSELKQVPLREIEQALEILNSIEGEES